MAPLLLAPCGVVCELCIAYQRPKNACVGCNAVGAKPNHCSQCAIKLCPEKDHGEQLCIECAKFPCRRLRSLEKRYSTKYGESPTANMTMARDRGRDGFSDWTRRSWSCAQCGGLLSAHRAACTICGAPNPRFPPPIGTT